MRIINKRIIELCNKIMLFNKIQQSMFENKRQSMDFLVTNAS